jgi:hypothetical protein
LDKTGPVGAIRTGSAGVRPIDGIGVDQAIGGQNVADRRQRLPRSGPGFPRLDDIGLGAGNLRRSSPTAGKRSVPGVQSGASVLLRNKCVCRGRGNAIA